MARNLPLGRSRKLLFFAPPIEDHRDHRDGPDHGQRQGMAVVLIARFVAVLRSVAGFIAGANRMPFANFMIADSAGAVAWALFYGLGAFHLGKGVEEFARPFALALAVVGTIVVVSMVLYWRRKEQELAAAAEREIPGPLQVEQSGEADR